MSDNYKAANKPSAANLKDRKYKGEDFLVDQKLADGPLEERRCTNMFCALLFIAFFVGMLTCVIVGFINGNIGKLMSPVDAQGRICGHNSATEGYPYLYIYNLQGAIADPSTMFTYGVCVESCPTATSTIECVNTQISGTSCASTTPRYGTTEFMGYCVPVESEMPTDLQSDYSALMNSFATSTGGGLVLDLYVARWFVLLGMAPTVIYTLIYIKFMDYCAFGIAWFSIVAVGVSMIIAGLVFFYDARDKSDLTGDYAFWLNLCAWTLWGSAILYCLCIALSFRSLQISLAVIETAADYFAQTKRILFIPVMFFCISLVWFCLWVGGFMCVASIGEITTSGDSQLKNVDWSSSTTTMVWYMIFGLIWTVSFFITCNDYVIIVSAATWYFSKKSDGGWEGHSDVWKGFQWIFKYNLGSLAFGSLVIALSCIIREIFEYIGEKLQEATSENCCVKCMIDTCLCCVDCTDRFVRYLTENAYIYMALSNDGFCESALNSFLLMLKNAAKFSFVSSVSNTFMFLAKISISFLTTYSCYGFMSLSSSMQEFQVDNPTAPLFLIFLFSYAVSAIFMSIFQVGANTILQCFLVDRDIAEQRNEIATMMTHVPEALKKFLDGYDEYKDKQDDQETLLSSTNQIN